MSIKGLTERLKRAADTPDTSAKNEGYQEKASVHAGCTPDTPDTSVFCNVWEKIHDEPVSDASNSPIPPAADLPATDPDRWAWPHSDAMNGQEIAIFMARQSLFHQRGVSPQDAERLADSLVKRDRDDDDRHLCLECRHLRGAGPYRCGNARAAGMHPDLALGFVQTLQRCNGYEDAKLPIGAKVDAAPPAPPAPAQQAPAPTAPTGPTWRELDKAYLAHHAQCPTCQSAGLGYGERCEAGAALWRAYSECIQAPLNRAAGIYPLGDR